jgi:rod shape-determining protein MreC
MHGIQEDSAVVTPAGIIGRVIHAANYSAIVQLIIDSQSGVGVMLRSTRRLGVLRGTGSGIDLEYIDDDNDLKENEQFITSGQDRIYPKGLPVGIITAVGERRGLFKTVQIQISADLSRLEEVICIIEHAPDVDVVGPVQEPPSP